MADVELRHLRSFLAVAGELSFTVAARRLFVTQQTLSRTIAQLERVVGEELFTRNTRLVELTPAGRAMIPQARAAVAAADDAVRLARGDGAEQRLRVDISSSGLETGALVIRELRESHPGIGIHQVEIGVRRGLDELRAGRLDAVFGLDPRLPDIASDAVRAEPVLVGMDARHPLADQAAVAVADLAAYPLLLPDPEAAGEWIDFISDFCRTAGFEPRQWPHITHGSTGAAEALREGDCVTPTNAWVDPPADLAFRPLVDPTPVFTWSLLWERSSTSLVRIQVLRECARRVRKRNSWDRRSNTSVEPEPDPKRPL